MQMGWLRKLVFCFAGLAGWQFAAAASLPEGALLQVRPFAFQKAAYQGAEEEADRLSSAFYRQLMAALEEAGIRLEAVALPEDMAEEDEVVPDSGALSSDAAEAEGEPESAGDEGAEKDALMQLVEEAEKAEKVEAAAGGEGEAAEKDRAGQAASGKKRVYVLAGKVAQYEEKVGVPVSTGKTRRTRVEVVISGRYRVTVSGGAVQADEPFAFSVSRIVPETADIHVVLQELGERAFFGAAHGIAGQVSGKKQVSHDDAEPGSEDDEYADSPGKRLKPTSGRMKWVLH